MDASAVILVALALGAAGLLVAVGWWIFSRYAGWPGSAAPPIPCAYRERAADSWTLGTVHYDGAQLVHRSLAGRSAVERHRWDRVRLDLGHAEHVGEYGVPSDLPRDLTLVVRCGCADTEFELALTEEHYTALRSWIEAAPPGWNANVA